MSNDIPPQIHRRIGILSNLLSYTLVDTGITNEIADYKD